MKRLIAVGFFSAALMLPTAGSAFADDPHAGGTTGQPSQSCGNTTPPAFPGNTGNSPGSAFNGSAGNVYANPTSQGGTSSGNPNVVAQYDVACFQQASH
jgi:hypothetical protein